MTPIEFGEIIAERFFNDFFGHPEYQGPKFEWTNFPRIVSRYAYVHSFLCEPPFTEDERRLVQEVALEKTKELMKREDKA